MNESVFARIRDWVEPAHPALVKQYEDLIKIYQVIREHLQGPVDTAFDHVAREIGFVVTTTLPVTLEIAGKEKPPAWSVAEPLKGSLFEKEILKAVTGPTPSPWKNVSAGKYTLYLVWFDALKLKLRKDWLEPAHFLRGDILERVTAATPVRPEVQEPAHWFIPGLAISVEDQILISVIDEVYPELRLAERVSLTRQALRRVRPDVMEPAHLRIDPRLEAVLREIAILVRRVRPDVIEPAHFRPMERDVLAEIGSILQKYGV
jgi:hypothetical protein